MMKAIILIGAIALAQPAVASNIPSARPSSLTPSALVTMAYRGQFSNQGIPGYTAFLSKYTLGRIDAKHIVQAAIAARLLPAEAIDNPRYLNAIRNQLESQLPAP
jgi:hypothetical protein